MPFGLLPSSLRGLDELAGSEARRGGSSIGRGPPLRVGELRNVAWAESLFILGPFADGIRVGELRNVAWAESLSS